MISEQQATQKIIDNMNEQIRNYTQLKMLLGDLITEIEIARDGVVATGKIEGLKQQSGNVFMEIMENDMKSNQDDELIDFLKNFEPNEGGISQ